MVHTGYADNGAYWRSWYESDTFRQEIERLWNEVRPLYVQLHAYVRRKLQERYPTGTFPADGHIPAHLLGQCIDLLRNEGTCTSVRKKVSF